MRAPFQDMRSGTTLPLQDISRTVPGHAFRNQFQDAKFQVASSCVCVSEHLWVSRELIRNPLFPGRTFPFQIAFPRFVRCKQ